MIFFLVSVIKTDVEIGKLKSIENEKAKLTASLDRATTDAVNYLTKLGVYGTSTINKDEVVNKFLTSFYSSLGIISDNNAKTEMEMYLPVLLLCDVDGYYVYYYEEYKGEDGLSYTSRQWSEKMPYYHKDKYFIYRFTLEDTVYLYDINHLLPVSQEVLAIDYKEIQTEGKYQEFREKYSDCILLDVEEYELVKKGAIINQLEKVLAYYTSRHNEIAAKNGITYTFTFPTEKEATWADFMEDVNLLVVFQGYPYGVGRNYTYNKIASAGANIIKKSNYIVEQRSWYYLAHKKDCLKVGASAIILDEIFETIKECAAYGAYCCDCIEHGARVPVIK